MSIIFGYLTNILILVKIGDGQFLVGVFLVAPREIRRERKRELGAIVASGNTRKYVALNFNVDERGPCGREGEYLCQ